MWHRLCGWLFSFILAAMAAAAAENLSFRRRLIILRRYRLAASSLAAGVWRRKLAYLQRLAPQLAAAAAIWRGGWRRRRGLAVAGVSMAAGSMAAIMALAWPAA